MSRAFVAFYPADYQRDTLHLSTLEHGAYFLLLQHCWQHGAIPLDGTARAQIAHVSPQQWVHLRANLEPYFDAHGRNKRATKEVEKAERSILRQTMAGHRGAAKRWGKPIAMANGHGQGAGTSHGIAIKKKDITTTYSSAAREDARSQVPSGSPMEPVEKPVIPVTAELVANIQKKWVRQC